MSAPTTFTDLGLSDALLDSVSKAGYSQPTPIQEKAIPYVQMGRDLLGCAQTGTGKTAGFTLPLIDMLADGRARARMPRSLILEPTRELAAQVGESFQKYGINHKLTMALLTGGTSLTDQERKLERGVDVLIATPGRLIDLIQRGKIILANVKILVIDEADRMLDMGFIPDIETIVGRLPPLRQTLFFSATMPPEIRRLADRFLSNPKEVAVSRPARTADTIEQAILRCGVETYRKREALRTLLNLDEPQSALVFCNRKRDVSTLQRSLERHGYDAKALHGDMSQPARTETLESFRDGKVRLMVCSDVAARGLDIPSVSHVYNYDVPSRPEDYVHRIGRTGRAGRQGKAFTLVTKADARSYANLLKLIEEELREVQLPEVETRAEDSAPPAVANTNSGPSSSHSRRRSGNSRHSGSTQIQPSNEPHNPTASFGDHTPAFLLRPLRVAQR
ncbi:MAG: DEAD/DEAH box helicase [Rhodospirillales bacterium]|nr:DEAD/DEAH box helicase [Rhodospirillales bacterium]